MTVNKRTDAFDTYFLEESVVLGKLAFPAAG